mmetsp:Transcript_62958/g.174516  ORF Transcript_62958/g.174516 Transcript_62958/m.174516 type:complete len:88 (+) Transcript_62958:223-486(+)
MHYRLRLYGALASSTYRDLQARRGLVPISAAMTRLFLLRLLRRRYLGWQSPPLLEPLPLHLLVRTWKHSAWCKLSRQLASLTTRFLF